MATTAVRRRTTKGVTIKHGQREGARTPAADSAPLVGKATALAVLDSRPLPKVPQRLPSKVNKRETLAGIAERIPIEIMKRFFDYPLRTAAEVRTWVALYVCNRGKTSKARPPAAVTFVARFFP